VNIFRNLIAVFYYLLIKGKFLSGFLYFLTLFDLSFFTKRIRTGQADDYPLAGDVDLQNVRYSVTEFRPFITNNHIFPYNHRSCRISNYDIKECERLMALFIHFYNTNESIRKNHFIGGGRGAWWWISLDAYERHYTAAVNNRGEKVVYINCFVDFGDEYSGRRGLLNKIFGNARPWDEAGGSPVDDGGNSYFRIKINLDTGRVIGYEENGVA
jgi:hypothetical protein